MPRKFTLMIALLLISLTVSSMVSAHPSSKDSLPVLNRPAPEFSLKDLNGKVVSLSDFKGKVVVLDFWATWCVPCQQSFPGMQKAVTHFADDNNVAFLFIDTRETSPDHQKIVRALLKRTQYPFYVIFDEIGPEGLQNKQYLIYGMPGIPTKFIIDKNGIIRYKLIGFDPRQSPDENAGEIISLVEKVKALNR